MKQQKIYLLLKVPINVKLSISLYNRFRIFDLSKCNGVKLILFWHMFPRMSLSDKEETLQL